MPSGKKRFKGIENAQRNVSNGIFLIEFYPSRVGSRAPSSRSSFACDKNIQYVRFDQLRHACSHVRSHSHHFGLNSSYDCENEPSQQKAGWGSRLCKYSLLLSQDQELLILSRWGFSATEPGQGGDQPLASTVFMITLVLSIKVSPYPRVSSTRQSCSISHICLQTWPTSVSSSSHGSCEQTATRSLWNALCVVENPDCTWWSGRRTQCSRRHAWLQRYSPAHCVQAKARDGPCVFILSASVTKVFFILSARAPLNQKWNWSPVPNDGQRLASCCNGRQYKSALWLEN